MGRKSEDIYLDALDQSTKTVIRAFMQAIDNMDSGTAFKLLDPLVKAGERAALYYAANSSRENETRDQFERRHIEQLRASAEMGYPPAIYRLGVYFDVGDMVSRDPEKAALHFKAAAEANHPHAQWIYGTDLLFGRNGIKHDEALGIKFIRDAAAAKFEGAVISIAQMYESGSHGFARDEAQSVEWRKKLNDPDVIED